MDQDQISSLYLIMFGPKLFWFSYKMQEYKKDKKGKTTQDVTHRALLAVNVRGASRPVFVQDTEKVATWQDERCCL